MRTRSSYRKPRSVPVMLKNIKKSKKKVNRPKKPAKTITNVPLNSIRQIASLLPSRSNRLSLYLSLPSHMRNAIPRRQITK